MHPEGRICALTGERGSGKSEVCLAVAGKAGLRGLEVAGIITERVGCEEDSSRRAIDLSSGEGRPFGSRRVRREGIGAGKTSACDPLTPGWDYDSEVFGWGQQVLAHSTPCDLLVIDEIGPLELLGGRGWIKGLEVLTSHAFRAALVVCRPDLLQELEDRLGEAPGAVFEVTPENRHGLPDTIVGELFGGGIGGR